LHQILHVYGSKKIFFGKTPLKFWTGVIKFSLVLFIMQNFTPVGSRILEISLEEKNHKFAQRESAWRFHSNWGKIKAGKFPRHQKPVA